MTNSSRFDELLEIFQEFFMEKQEENYLPVILNSAIAIATILISIFLDWRISLPVTIAKISGVVFVYSGMAIVLWAGFYLKQSISGIIQPKSNSLVTTGPYKVIRHPVYFGFTIAITGITVMLRSWQDFYWFFLLFCQQKYIVPDVKKKHWNKHLEMNGVSIKKLHSSFIK